MEFALFVVNACSVVVTMIENTHPLHKMHQKNRYSKYYNTFFFNSAGWVFHHIAGMPTILICPKNMFFPEFSTFLKQKNENKRLWNVQE